MVLSSNVTEENGIKLVDEVVKTWDISDCWLYCIDFMEKDGDNLQYRVKWSIPTRRAPVPAVTASVYFTIDVSGKDADIYYVLEAQRLIHKPGKIVFREKWLKDIASTKTMIIDDVTF